MGCPLAIGVPAKANATGVAVCVGIEVDVIVLVGGSVMDGVDVGIPGSSSGWQAARITSARTTGRSRKTHFIGLAG